MFSTVTYSMIGVEPAPPSSSTTSDCLDTEGDKDIQSIFIYTGRRRRRREKGEERAGAAGAGGAGTGGAAAAARPLASSPLSRLCR